MDRDLGVALDIGTTTVGGKLIDLTNSKELSCYFCLNKQLPQGHDVITRIKSCLDRPDGLEKLHKKVISSINEVIDNLSGLAGQDKRKISFILAVGNPAMYHFTLMLSPKRLAEPPYEPEHKGLVRRKARSLGIKAGEDCNFEFLPNIGGFVGSDALAVILAADIDKSKDPVLAIDLGTNGEIILGSKDNILVTSTAAGPAFEGWHISCGMRPNQGAIESVKEKGGRLSFGVIGGGKPKGISGSGLVDIIAVLLRKKYIDISGRMKEDFILYENGEKIFLSQDDVRQVQLAKAAISVGMDFLKGHSDKKVSRLVITGKFGGCLDRDNAREIGMIPADIKYDMVEALENGALNGAVRYLVNRGQAASRIDKILQKTRHIMLGSGTGFQKAFAGAMRF